MNAEETAFRAAIAAGDAAARGVFSDWLDERDRPAEADYQRAMLDYYPVSFYKCCDDPECPYSPSYGFSEDDLEPGWMVLAVRRLRERLGWPEDYPREKDAEWNRQVALMVGWPSREACEEDLEAAYLEWKKWQACVCQSGQAGVLEGSSFYERVNMAKRKSSGELHRAAVKLGEAGGKKGGPARAKDLTAQQRKEIARKGGLAKGRKKA